MKTHFQHQKIAPPSPKTYNTILKKIDIILKEMYYDHQRNAQPTARKFIIICNKIHYHPHRNTLQSSEDCTTMLKENP